MGQFDPSKLKAGDEVGVTWEAWGGPAVFTCRVAAIEDKGFIRVEGQELPFWPDDGRQVEMILDGVIAPCPHGTRLCEPTDEGRANSLREDLGYELESLRDDLEGLTLDELRQFASESKSLKAKYGARAAIDVPAVEDRKPALEAVGEDKAMPGQAGRCADDDDEQDPVMTAWALEAAKIRAIAEAWPDDVKGLYVMLLGTLTRDLEYQCGIAPRTVSLE